jgi:hypothetical protein
VYGGWAVVLVEPVGPVDVDAIWLPKETSNILIYE